jgi:hypothetical protein
MPAPDLIRTEEELRAAEIAVHEAHDALTRKEIRARNRMAATIRAMWKREKVAKRGLEHARRTMESHRDKSSADEVGQCWWQMEDDMSLTFLLEAHRGLGVTDDDARP